MKCDTCHQEVRPDCDWRQGRCPHRPPDVNNLPTWLLILTAPFIIIPWTIMNPRKVWQQVKEDWKIK